MSRAGAIGKQALAGLTAAKDVVVRKTSVFWMRRRLNRLTHAIGQIVLSRGIAIPGAETQVTDAQSLQQEIQAADGGVKRASRALLDNKIGLAAVGCVVLLLCVAGWLIFGRDLQGKGRTSNQPTSGDAGSLQPDNAFIGASASEVQRLRLGEPITFWELDGLEKVTQLRVTFEDCFEPPSETKRQTSPRFLFTALYKPPEGKRLLCVWGKVENLGPRMSVTRRMRGFERFREEGPPTEFAELETQDGFRYKAAADRTAASHDDPKATDNSEYIEPGHSKGILFSVVLPTDAKPVALHASFNGPTNSPGSILFRLDLSGVPIALPKDFYASE